MTTKAFFDKLDKACARFTPLDESFSLWVDRQQRPTFGATVRGIEERCLSRRDDVDDELFLSMLHSLSELLGSVEKPYLTYNAGSWQRQKKHLAVKAYLTTEAFLTLTNKICEDADIGENKFNSKKIKAELQRRQEIDYHYEKIEKLFAKKSSDFNVLVKNLGKESYRIFTTKETLYPVVLLASDAARSTSIAVENLPAALDALEDYLLNKWKAKGYAIGMLGQDKGNSFKLVAVVEEKNYCDNIDGHDESTLKKNWEWKEPRRSYYHKPYGK